MGVKIWRPTALGDIELYRGNQVKVSIPRHLHEEFQIGLVQGGAIDLHIAHVHHTWVSGEIFVVHPGEVHVSQSIGEQGWTYHMFYAGADILQDTLSELVDRQHEVPRFQRLGHFDRSLLSSVSELYRAVEQSESLLEQQSHLLLALVGLVRCCGEEHAPLRPLGREHQAVKDVQEYIEAHYAKAVSLDQLASIVCMSKFHLVRVFTAAVGIPPHAFQTQMRVSRARRLLSEGMSPAQVAALTGFAHQSHLTRHFARILNFTPGHYAQLSKNVQDFPSQ